MIVWNRVHASFYRDSVTLMRLSADMERVAGVRRAAAMMGTPQNLALLRDAGLLAPESEGAGPTDLVVAVGADTAEAARAAADAVEARLLAPPVVAPGAPAARPRTLASALRALPDASIALVSVPGPYAAAEAFKALRAGLHVMLFSDNVPLETEVELKRLALAQGLLMMGPDCGTAIVDGVPLGFVNTVPPGRIGLVAASGTGLQEVMCVLAREGEGVSQAIGVGGRDLSDAVGGLMTLHALDLLAADAATAVVCLVGKPPAAGTTRRLVERIERLGKPCVTYLATAGTPGGGGAALAGAGAQVAATLEDAGRAAAALAAGRTPAPQEFTLSAHEIERLIDDAARSLAPGRRYVRGLYAGGTLAWEALALLRTALRDVAPSLTTGGPAHWVVDLGEDLFTVGRPHPMIDGGGRREWIVRQASDPATAVLLLDVVLGSAVNADPAGDIVAALGRARDPVTVASVCGTDADTPSRAAQVAALRAAGVIVMDSNAQAARLAARIARRAGAPGPA